MLRLGPGNAGEKSISEGLACAYMQRDGRGGVGIPTVELRKQQKEGRIVLIKRARKVFVSGERITVGNIFSILIETVAFKEFRSGLCMLNKACLAPLTDLTGRNNTHRTDVLPPSSLKRISTIFPAGYGGLS